MPMIGLPSEAVETAVRGALAGDARITVMAFAPDELAGRHGREHVAFAMRFEAESADEAGRLANEWHRRALDRVLAAAPEEQGWTSGYEAPEPVAQEP